MPSRETDRELVDRRTIPLVVLHGKCEIILIATPKRKMGFTILVVPHEVGEVGGTEMGWARTPREGSSESENTGTKRFSPRNVVHANT
jgi:hypothetical protein